MALLDADRVSTSATEATRAVLANDHERLDRSCEAIVAELSRGNSIDVRDRWRMFERQILGHLDANETEMSAFARQDPDEAGALLDTHAQIRARLAELAIDLDLHCLQAEQLRAFIEEVRMHLRHEEELLYPWAGRRWSQSGRDESRVALDESHGQPSRGATCDEWRIDPEHSSLRFSLRHIVVHEIRGEFTRWGGVIRLDSIHPVRSNVEVWVDLGSVDTGERERDDHVRSPEFFDVARFPKAQFTSFDVRTENGRSTTVRGRLDLHGNKKDVDLEVTGREGWTDALGAERVGYWVKGRLDRREFGLRWNQDLDLGGIVVGDQIEILAYVESVRAKP